MQQIGVFVIAHGSRNEQWVQAIENMVASCSLDYPVTVGYLELVQGKSIADGIKKLEALGVTHAIVVPLFISSGSTHLDEIRYALGIQSSTVVETDLEQIEHGIELIWQAPMDDHPLIVEILSERLSALSTSSKTNTVLLVAHGSDHPLFMSKWHRCLAHMAEQLQQRNDVRSVYFATMLPDTVRVEALRIKCDQQLIVLPVFLSSGYYTQIAIPSRLEGMTYVYDGQGYLPHQNVRKWINAQVQAGCLSI